MKEKKGKLARKEAREGYLYALPWFIGFTVFTAGPIIASFLLSFTNWDLIRPAEWIGFGNYNMLLEDPLFWQSLKVTSIYALFSVPLGILGGLAIAVLMNQKIKGLSVFRTIYYLPAVVSGVAVSLLWSWIFNPDFGVLNYLLSLIGINGPGWIYDEKWALPSLIIMSLWGVGGGMVIYLAGLQGVPTELYEAAIIDGASSWRRFWSITIPMISPVIFFQLIMGIIGSFQIFTQAYIMTGGGPNNATLFYVLYLYRNAFQWFKMGYASALAWVLFIVILILTIIQFKLANRWVYYEGGK
ncbi:MAG TPA: sugar ABC transporter permease [Methanothermobacter sp.]|nr:sugar ABC transporter permease [Methanothermobacter sp.]